MLTDGLRVYICIAAINSNMTNDYCSGYLLLLFETQARNIFVLVLGFFLSRLSTSSVDILFLKIFKGIILVSPSGIKFGLLCSQAHIF